MNRTTILNTAVLLFAFCIASCTPDARPTSASLVLRFSPQGVLLCEVNGKAITVLIDELRKLYQLNGPNMRLNIFYEENVAIDEIFSMMPVVKKVGFTNVHTYLFDRNKSGMTEINFGNERPFTLEP